MKKIVRMILLCSLLVLSVVMVGCMSRVSSTETIPVKNVPRFKISPPEWLQGKWILDDNIKESYYNKISIDFYKEDNYQRLSLNDKYNEKKGTKYYVSNDSSDIKSIKELVINEEKYEIEVQASNQPKPFIYSFIKNKDGSIGYINPEKQEYNLIKNYQKKQLSNFLHPPIDVHGYWYSTNICIYFDINHVEFINTDELLNGRADEIYVYDCEQKIIDGYYTITIQFLKSVPEKCIYKFKVEGQGEDRKLIYIDPDENRHELEEAI